MHVRDPYSAPVASNSPPPGRVPHPIKSDKGAHWQVELAQLGGAAEIGQVDDEAGGEHLRTELA
jgi:hypothetical protein